MTSENFSYSGYATVLAEFSNGPEPWDTISFIFNDVHFSDGNAVINFVPPFNLPETEGRFTLTDIPAGLNGKYAIMFGLIDSSNVLYGINGADSVSTFKGFQVVDGKVDIPVYSYILGDTAFEAYSGDDKLMSLVVIFVPTPDYDWGNYNPKDIQGLSYISDITFQSGTMSKAFDDKYWVGASWE